MKPKIFSVIFCTLLFICEIFSQGIPQTINFQGVLKDASGNIVSNGDYNLTFKIYNAETGGTSLWTETKLVNVVDGIFSTQLGSATPINLPFDAAYWLGITIGGGSELTPRVAFSSVPYSRMSLSVPDNSLTASKIQTGQLVKSINGLKDSINLVAGSNVTITPSGNDLTISAAGGGGGTVTQVNTGSGLTGGPITTTGTISIANDGITTAMLQNNSVTSSKIADGSVTVSDLSDSSVTSAKIVDGTVSTSDLANNSVTTDKIVDGTITATDIANTQVVKSINSLKDNVNLVAGSNVTITPSGQNLTISASGGGGGTVTQVNTGAGLTGGPITTTGTISIANDGITNAMLQNNSVTSSKINDGTITTTDIANNAVTSSKIQLPISLNGSSTYPIISGTNSSTGYGVLGSNSSSGNIGYIGGKDIAVYGYHNSSGNEGYLGTNLYGVHGSASSNHIGIYGESSTGYSVYGYNNSAGNYGLLGSSTYGVYGYNSSNNSSGNYGYIAGQRYGVYGYHQNSGNYGLLGADGFGVMGNTANEYDCGVKGYAESGGCGISGVSIRGDGVEGSSYEGTGVFGWNINYQNKGYLGDIYNAVAGLSERGDGVWGYSYSGYAGNFIGNVRITGTLSKGGGSFKIDHPLDPQNKYLYHSFVESPDMKNIYDGTVVTDASGYATVTLPDWFEALNKDFRYQLTVIGDFAQAIVFKKIQNNQFTIRTDKPNVEVSWQVTGIRHDAFAEKNRIPVEEYKKGDDVGKYLHPDAYGLPEMMGIDYKHRAELEKREKEK